MATWMEEKGRQSRGDEQTHTYVSPKKVSPGLTLFLTPHFRGPPKTCGVVSKSLFSHFFLTMWFSENRETELWVTGRKVPKPKDCYR